MRSTKSRRIKRSIGPAKNNISAKIPYRKAWSYLHMMENRLGIKMMSTQVGGANGGGTQLSKEAKELLCRYERISSHLEGFVEKEFADFLMTMRYAI